LENALEVLVAGVSLLSFPNCSTEDKHRTVIRDKKEATPSEGDWIAFYGIFGYNSIEDHMRWRETPEHAQIMEIFDGLNKTQGLKPADMFGKSMFHVHFNKGQ
jgi:hypothetical protein